MNSDTDAVKYRLAKQSDLPTLAKIYCSLYVNSALKENWTLESAYGLLDYFYRLNQDIFVVAEYNALPIGAIASLVKPWHDGNRLIETEAFVDQGHQKQGIGSQLFREHFDLAVEKYNVKVIEAYTYKEADGYPLNWYRKQGYDIVHDWFVINGDINKIRKYFADAHVKVGSTSSQPSKKEEVRL